MKPYKTKGEQNHKTSSMTTRFKSQKASLNSCKSKVIEILVSIVEVTTVWSSKIRICKENNLGTESWNLDFTLISNKQHFGSHDDYKVLQNFILNNMLKVYLQNWGAPKTDCLIHLKDKKHFVMA